MVHLPANGNGKAVVFCQPFADDVQRSYRPLYNFAEALARDGYVAFRFEYRGCGDSQGEHVDTDITSRLEDISEAISFVKNKYGIEQVALFGLRFGGTLAALSATGRDDIKALLLWEPIVNGHEYIDGSLKTNITTQVAIYRKVRFDRDQLIEKMRQGEPAFIDGYEIGERLYDQAGEIDLANSPAKFAGPTFWATIWPKNRRLNEDTVAAVRQVADGFPNSTHTVVNDISFWIDKRTYLPDSPELVEQTLEWVRGNF